MFSCACARECACACVVLYGVVRVRVRVRVPCAGVLFVTGVYCVCGAPLDRLDLSRSGVCPASRGQPPLIPAPLSQRAHHTPPLPPTAEQVDPHRRRRHAVSSGSACHGVLSALRCHSVPLPVSRARVPPSLRSHSSPQSRRVRQALKRKGACAAV
jgi:hypothetical protein